MISARLNQRLPKTAATASASFTSNNATRSLSQWSNSNSNNKLSASSAYGYSCAYRLTSPIQLQLRHKASSTASSFFDSTNMIPNTIKNTLKNSLLNEAARHDSKLWSDHDYHIEQQQQQQQQQRQQQQQTKYTNDNSSSSSSSSSSSKKIMNGTNSSSNQLQNQYTSVVNDPISQARLEMLNDPLNEWYLQTKPGSIQTIPLPKLTPQNDPFVISQNDMSSLSSNIRQDLIGNDHPVLSKVASYFFESGKDGGKKVRPMMVLLLSRALSLSSSTKHHHHENDNYNHVLFTSQKRLAEISEMIHTASLFHDDVIDKADTRRGNAAVHKVFGNKMAILAGDYLLARASVFLARLRNVEVVETMSTIIEHLVRGEVMQMNSGGSGSGSGSGSGQQQQEQMIHYLRKNFYKTASLMANSCKSAAILGQYDDEIVEASYKYGKHLGIAFQLVDDVLDFDGSASDMGKASLADLNAGLATAPVLFAAEEFSNDIQPLIERKFSYEGDVEKAVEILRKSDGIQRTKDLAQVHVELAIESIMKSVGPSDYRDSLVHLARKVVDRTR